ncbi:hypothetical protein A1Q1_02492 [Trichosporon asahii var. asahii CBS 2479]|uniref:Uncharacterized protein n=1 Tax=Trichosporon asahii var. asahii (strain ATCC 90039 / CBS 2479 / JCM 2466 / KCTC 7840 / NBRC 103889/ NCYC 2677 / UAMH 7654) TaxID=1186058 RepID=J5T090_TRIAS|nr:hypothetical protein A1Q1_02492 [Trichosporon asahii var. asahii CBS 2479]EJT48471.1 hypothetical protein A1Q1_02492 [Trichosporon asahii var. asahii CBS 2479]
MAEKHGAGLKELSELDLGAEIVLVDWEEDDPEVAIMTRPANLAEPPVLAASQEIPQHGDPAVHLRPDEHERRVAGHNGALGHDLVPHLASRVRDERHSVPCLLRCCVARDSPAVRALWEEEDLSGRDAAERAPLPAPGVHA